MTAEEMIRARTALGEAWGAGRPLTRMEMARALGFSDKSGNDNLKKIEDGTSRITGTVAILTRLYLAGAAPPDDVQIFKAHGRAKKP